LPILPILKGNNHAKWLTCWYFYFFGVWPKAMSELSVPNC
jgi:hypothetical protein